MIYYVFIRYVYVYVYSRIWIYVHLRTHWHKYMKLIAITCIEHEDQVSWFPKKCCCRSRGFTAFRHQVVQAEASAGWCEAFEWHGTQQNWRWDDSTSSTCFCAQVRTVRLLRLAAGFKQWQGLAFLLTSIEMRSVNSKKIPGQKICIHMIPYEYAWFDKLDASIAGSQCLGCFPRLGSTHLCAFLGPRLLAGSLLHIIFW